MPTGSETRTLTWILVWQVFHFRMSRDGKDPTEANLLNVLHYYPGLTGDGGFKPGTMTLPRNHIPCTASSLRVLCSVTPLSECIGAGPSLEDPATLIAMACACATTLFGTNLSRTRALIGTKRRRVPGKRLLVFDFAAWVLASDARAGVRRGMQPQTRCLKRSGSKRRLRKSRTQRRCEAGSERSGGAQTDPGALRLDACV
eukprot:3511663-Rhodomonas_salina.2